MSIVKTISTITAVIAMLAAVTILNSPSASETKLTQEPSAPQCTARSTMISRAQDWADKHIPYNQGGTYDGYRTDCSGYVSMAWQLGRPGLTTQTMHTVATNIAKANLQPGDALNCDTEHIVLFGGWTDSSQTHYVAYEQTRPGEGTVKRATPYPYWYNEGCFHPIRYNGVC